MKYALFATEYPAEFREAYGDLDMHVIGSLCDKYDLTEIGRLVFNNIEAAKESAEDNIKKGGEHGEEARLDGRNRARDVKKELT